MIKAVKIEETLEDFLEAHPELIVTRNGLGKVDRISFPEEATNPSYAIVYDSVEIHYNYKGESINFPEFLKSLNDN